MALNLSVTKKVQFEPFLIKRKNSFWLFTINLVQILWFTKQSQKKREEKLVFDPNRVSREKQYMRRLKVSLVEFGMGSGGSP